MHRASELAKWYAIHLVFKSQVGDSLDIDPLCEDRVVLFLASQEQTARDAAERYALDEQTQYRNEAGELVTWRFAGIEGIEELGSDPVPSGWEVASRHFRPSDLRREKEVEDRASE